MWTPVYHVELLSLYCGYPVSWLPWPLDALPLESGGAGGSSVGAQHTGVLLAGCAGDRGGTRLLLRPLYEQSALWAGGWLANPGRSPGPIRARGRP